MQTGVHWRSRVPLPAPVSPREPVYGRQITLDAFRRSDCLWDFDGHVTDVRHHDLRLGHFVRLAGEPVHSMRLRITVDCGATIVDAVARSGAGPYDAACGAIEPAYEALIGLQVGPGYRSEVRKRIGGRAGCTHMTELASALGPAVVQALAIDVPAPPDKRPFSLDGCHALATTGSLVAIHFPRCYRDPTADGAQAQQTPRHRAASDSENAEGDKTP